MTHTAPVEPSASVASPSANDAEAGAMRWFVMRDLKRQNAKMPAYKQLAEGGFQVFTPMKSQLVTRNGKRQRLQVPFISDLLFVYSSRDALDPVVTKTPTLQYRFQRGGAYCEPMTVREAEMRRFIAAVENSPSALYFTPAEITPDMVGRQVCVVDGPLEGYIGRLMAVRGSRVKRLLVDLPNMLTVGVEIESEFIKFL